MKKVLLAFLMTASVFAADWPQFQGPNRDGISPETGLARSWPELGPKTVWKIPMADGFGGPAVRDGKVYFLDRVEERNEVLFCLDLETGETQWQSSYEAPGKFSYNGTRSTPTVTEKYVYTVGMTGKLNCFDRVSGARVWNVDLVGDYPPASNQRWGTAQAPYIHDDLLIVAPQSKKGFVVALNRLTGEEEWASERLGNVGYSSPIVANLCGVDQVVMISAGDGGAGGVAGLSLSDGSVLWQYKKWGCRIPIPFATPLPDDRLFLTGEYGAGSAMIQVKKSGNKFSVDELYMTQDCGSQIHQPLYLDGYLYMNSNGNKRNDGMLCLSLDGELQWKTRDNRDFPRFERGGLLMVDGLIINFDGRRGTLHLVDPSPEGYKELAGAKVFDGNTMWSPIAFSNGKLLIRSQETLKCFDLRASSGG